MKKTGDLSRSEPEAESGRNGLLEALPLLMMEALSSIQRGEHLTGILPAVLREVEKYLPAARCRLHLADELLCAQPLSAAAGRVSGPRSQRPRWLVPGSGCEARAGEGFPLYSSAGKLSGTLQVYWQGAPDPTFAPVLHLVARVLAALVEHFCFCAQLSRNASHDDLTGLFNRSIFFEFLEAELNKAARTGTAFSVMMMDLDHFKAINDHYGHQAGDEVLCRAALWLKTCLRPYDHPGRWGGDEFVIVLSPCDPQTLDQIAHRIRAHVEVESQRTGTPVTVSVGGYYGQPGEGLDTLLRHADQALYQAKQRGRNCVFIRRPQNEPIRPA